MCFWNQVEVSLNNKTAYRQTAQNIAVPLSEGVDGVRMVAQWLKFVGLEKYAKQLSSVSGLAEMFIKVLSIPSDADDTGVNLALGYTLLNSKKVFKFTFKVLPINFLSYFPLHFKNGQKIIKTKITIFFLFMINIVFLPNFLLTSI